MTFTDPAFLLFLAGAACLYRLCRARFRAACLLAISYLFYLLNAPLPAAILAGLTLLAFAGAIQTEKHRGTSWSKALAAFLVLVPAGCMIAFKAALLTPTHGIAGIVLPLGMSYYVFKLISYVLDVYWGKMAATRHLLDFAAYVSFFPQMVAGPIERADDFLWQSGAAANRTAGAVARIAWGFTKKLAIADNLAPAVNFVYAHATGLKGAPLWIGFYLFPLQLYADFSGLTDIAIGAGRLFGIEGPENFNRPFSASSISDYWRRWHMSLTHWLGDYVFTPLRVALRGIGSAGLALSLTINMVAIALWHGFTAGYLVFGLLHAGYLMADTFTSRRRAKFLKRHPRWKAAEAWLGWFVTFHLVAIALVYFRAAHLSDGTWLLSHLFSSTAGAGGLLEIIAAVGLRSFLVGITGYCVLDLAERTRPDVLLAKFWPVAPRWARWSVCSASAVVLCTGLALFLVHCGTGHTSFIYEIF